MAVRLRLTRVGGRKNPIWRVVAADQRSKRDGRVLETIGHYNAQTQPSTIVLDEERVRHWLARGAQPTETVTQAAQDAGHQRPREQLIAAPAPMKELLEYLARELVDEPDEVSVEEFEEDDGTLVLELSVGDDDYGKVIGRGGRTANALRLVVKAAAVKEDRRVLVDIVD